MDTLFLVLLSLPVLTARVDDPSAGIWQTKTESRNLECTRMSHAEAHRLYPGQIPPTPARELPGDFEVMVCTRRMLDYGERPTRDDALLSTLSHTVGEITQVASALGAEGTVWHVDAFYPDPQVASKISVAARTDLAERGQRVSDRVPVLAAGDISVLGRMAPKDAYPLACARYFAQGVLKERDALLGLMIVDERETQLHAGICVGGQWRWLR